jgi:ABC-type transport system involved in cytochrome c biogenesis ATPase subunit
MFQRDYIMNEARKFALMLAKLLGLKAESEYEEYLKYFNEVLDEEYNAELEELLKLDEEGFKKRLIDAGYSSEKLNALGQMLYVFAEPFIADKETSALLKKVMVIFDLLETEHHYESFDNITKRNVIYQYFNNNYERT